MNHELAKTLTIALVQFIDREIPEGTMCCSNIECKSIEQMLEAEHFNIVEAFIRKKLSKLTEFEEELVNFYNKRSVLPQDKDGTYNRHDCEELLHESAKKLLELAKKELARRDEVITLNNLTPYDKGFQDGKAEALADLERTYFCNPDKLPKWLKDDIARKELNAHTKGYNKGYKDAEQWYNDWIAAHSPIMPTIPFIFGCDGTHCTNPQMDCVNCPKKITGGGYSTQSETETATLKTEG